MRKQKDILIVGAGAAGLMAAKQLSAAGLSVTILEAAPVAGGRMATLVNSSFSMPVETGAEFIHGNVQQTMQLLKEAGINYTKVAGEMLRIQNDDLHNEEKSKDEDHWAELMQCMYEQQEDITVKDFLDQYFAEEKYASLRRSVQGFAEGYDLADISKAALFALRAEWSQGQEEDQYRIEGGYIRLVGYLLETCLRHNAVIHYNTCVKAIRWDEGRVEALTADGKIFKSSKILITVSTGVLKSGKIDFFPAIPTYIQAAANIGFGSVIKILLEFKLAFWKARTANAGFILSDEIIPTWWTQLPAQNNLLTGWLGGPKAVTYANKTSEEIIHLSIVSLSAIFNIPYEKLRDDLLAYAVYNWHYNENMLGGYSYNTITSAEAKQILNKPVVNTVFFAGEALYTGDEPGTVEAALQTAIDAVKLISEC